MSLSPVPPARWLNGRLPLLGAAWLREDGVASQAEAGALGDVLWTRVLSVPPTQAAAQANAARGRLPAGP